MASKFTARIGLVSGFYALLMLLAGASAFRLDAATNIAVFGNNGIIPLINSMPGFSATLVTDGQIATAGFLNSFSAFVMTRDGSSFGVGLSAGAAANVAAYVGGTGAVVLFDCDCADSTGSSNPGDLKVQQLLKNAVAFAASGGHGFVGEFNGTVSALTSNSNGFNPIGLISGTAGPLGFGLGGSTGNMNLTAAGAVHPITSGVAFPLNPESVEFGADITGVNPGLILATFDNGNPAIIAQGSGTVSLGGGGACPDHTVHGHVTTTPPDSHDGDSHVHHGQHGHTITPGTECLPPGHHVLVNGHILGLTPEPGEGFFHLPRPPAGEPDFVAALNQDGGTGPASRGTILQLFGSARGLFLDLADQKPALNFAPPASGTPLYYTDTLPEVSIGGIAAQVLFSGLAPGLTGVWQINVRVPDAVSPGRAPVSIVYGGAVLQSIDVAVR